MATESTTVMRHEIWHNTVQCPTRGSVDIDLCMECPLLVSIDLDSASPSLRCLGRAGSQSAKERRAYRWLSLIQMADRSGNVTKTCREHGISRTLFYRYKLKFEQEGFAGLLK